MYQQYLFVSSRANSPCGSRHRAVCRLRADTPPPASVQMWFLPCRWRRKCVYVWAGVRRGTTLIMGKTDRGLPGNGSLAVRCGQVDGRRKWRAAGSCVAVQDMEADGWLHCGYAEVWRSYQKVSIPKINRLKLSGEKASRPFVMVILQNTQIHMTRYSGQNCAFKTESFWTLWLFLVPPGLIWTRQAMYLQTSTEERSCSHCRRGKAIGITYSECVCL